MTCSECGGRAPFLVTEGGVQTLLCVRCAEARTGLLSLGSFAAAFERPRESDEVCPHCGTTREDALKQGLVGCPLCYEVFPAEVWEHFGLKGS